MKRSIWFKGLLAWMMLALLSQGFGGLAVLAEEDESITEASTNGEDLPEIAPPEADSRLSLSLDMDEQASQPPEEASIQSAVPDD